MKNLKLMNSFKCSLKYQVKWGLWIYNFLKGDPWSEKNLTVFSKVCKPCNNQKVEMITLYDNIDDEYIQSKAKRSNYGSKC